ncbi:GNAT family N-acetyltransferase [Rhodopirellula sp. SM50]|nr:GNAT family N-acetyltransferase [Rhodopirellula sp. SM50]
MTAYRIEALANHDRKAFDCGSPELNDYLAKRVSQDVRRRFTACFVMIEKSSGEIAGYYTLSAGGVSIQDLPQHVATKLPRYPSVPVVRLGRLAVAKPHQGKKLGGLLLIDGIRRAVKSEIAAYAIVVEAKDENAIRFYEHYGFTAFSARSNSLFLPLQQAVRDLI